MQSSTQYMEDQDRIKELFLEQVSGIIDDRGIAELDAFRQKGAEQEAFLKGLEEESLRIGLYDFAARVQATEDLQKIGSKQRVNYPWKWISVAASLLILSSIGGFWLLNNPSEPTETKQLVLSDSGEVTLETSNGNKLNVEGKRLEYFKNAEEVISMHTLRVPRRKEYELVLADGTKVWMNADSKLTYPSHFSEGKREVYLEGEAFFEVSASEQEPFLIHVAGRQIQVLGTSFLVEAYNNDRVATSLLEGKVRLDSDVGSMILLPGERGIQGSQQLSKETFDPTNLLLLREGSYVIEDKRLEDLAPILERWYDVEVTFKDPSIKKHKISGLMEKGQLPYFLEDLQATSGVRFHIEGKELEFY